MFLSKEASYIYVAIIVPASIIIPLVPAVVKYRTLPKGMKAISLYLILAAATNIIGNLVARYRINNMPVMHVYTLLEFVLLMLFYREMFDEKGGRMYVNALIPMFVLLCLVNVLFFQDIHTYNTYTKSVEAVVVITLAIAYFKKTLDRSDHQPGGPDSLIYVNSGLLLYFAGSFILFIIPNMIIPDLALGRIIWRIHATFLLIMYQLFAIALWKHKK